MISGASPQPNPNDERLWHPGSAGVYARTGVYVSPEAVMQLDVVEGCMVALAGPLSTLPIGVFERDKTEGDVDSLQGSASGYKRMLRDHPLVKLLNKRPNRRQTSQEFRGELFRHLAMRRNSYCEIIQDTQSGDIAALEMIHPDRVTKVERRGGRVLYTIAGLQGESPRTLDEDRVWHIRMSPLDAAGLQGRPVYETSREVFGRAIAIMEYGNDFFNNSGQSGGFIKHPGQFKTKEDEEEFLRNWREQSTGPSRHKDRLLKHGLDYSAGTTVSNDAGQFVESMREAALAVCRLWNMPPHRVGILDRATFSNIEQQALEFVMYCLMLFIAAFEQAVERDLLLDANADDLAVEMNVTALLRGDIQARFKSYALGRQWGWLSVNDIRRLENQEPIEGGDVYLQPANMQAVGDAEDQAVDDAETAKDAATEDETPGNGKLPNDTGKNDD